MEPLAHYIIPTVLLLALNPGIDQKRVLKYSPLALFPDLDFFFGHAILHNIFAVILVSVAVYHLARRNNAAFLLSAYFLLAHLVLDLGFVALFYPLRSSMISLNIKIYTSPLIGIRILNMLRGRESIWEGMTEFVKSDSSFVEYPLEAAKTSEVAPLLTQFGLMLALILALSVAFKNAVAEGKRNGK